jgi:hypothetical protein
MGGDLMSETFEREVWRLTMNWLCTGESGLPEDEEGRQKLALAARRDPDVAQVDAWRTEAEPIPDWARQIDRETPHWGVEICNAAWLSYLERQIANIGNARWHPAAGWCGDEPLSRRQWAAWADAALDKWLDQAPADEDNPLAAEIYALLGERDEDKAGAARLLQETIELGIAVPPRAFEARFAELEATTPLAQEMRNKVKYLQFRCGYRWERIVLESCRAIGDAAYRQGAPRFWHVGSCNGQIAFAGRDDPLRIPTTAGVLVGLWAWLKHIDADRVAAAYPQVAAVAERVRQFLGERTPVKRWLAGRLSIGVRTWLLEYDHGDLAPPRSALETYPTPGGTDL